MKRILFLLFILFEVVHGKTCLAREVSVSPATQIAAPACIFINDSSTPINLNFYADVLDEDNDTSDPERKKLITDQKSSTSSSFVITQLHDNPSRIARYQNQYHSIHLPLVKVLRL